ncbi:unnamed protein product [Durusdinium trenchii]|uniref:Uncharacterized protein n=1 Tax=Durusdinium trenchii TaxID=1381693 RepID=A0ABP0PNF2_9DINO
MRRTLLFAPTADTFPNSCTTVTLFDANLIWGKGEKPMGHAFLAFFSYSNYYKDDKGETGSQRTLDVRVMLRSISAGKENAMCSGSFQVQNGSCFGINTGSNRYNAEATEPLPAPTLDGEPPWPIPDYIKTPSKADQLGPLWIALCVLLICARCACRFYFRRRRAADAEIQRHLESVIVEKTGGAKPVQAGLPAVSLAAILNKVPGGSERMANVTRGLRGSASMAVRSAAPSRLDGAAQADAAMAHGAERMTPDGCGCHDRPDVSTQKRKDRAPNLFLQAPPLDRKVWLNGQCIQRVRQCARGQDLGRKGAQRLARALLPHQSLRELNLACTKLTDAGIAYVAGALQRNVSLVSVNLRNNELGDVGTEALASALSCAWKENESYQLVELNLSGNLFSDLGLQAFGEVLGSGCPLKLLELSHLKCLG